MSLVVILLYFIFIFLDKCDIVVPVDKEFSV